MLLVVAGVGALFVRVRDFRPDGIRQSSEEGYAFGHGKTSSACVDEAVARATTRCGKYNGPACVNRTQMFLLGCLNSASEPEGFCASVPERALFSFSTGWASGECARRGHAGDARCISMLVTLQVHCTRRTR